MKAVYLGEVCHLADLNALVAISRSMWAVNFAPPKSSSSQLGCQLTRFELYNGRKMVVCMAFCFMF